MPAQFVGDWTRAASGPAKRWYPSGAGLLEALIQGGGHLRDCFGAGLDGLGGYQAVDGAGDGVELLDFGAHGVEGFVDFWDIGEAALGDGCEGMVGGAQGCVYGGLDGEIRRGVGELGPGGVDDSELLAEVAGHLRAVEGGEDLGEEGELVDEEGAVGLL